MYSEQKKERKNLFLINSCQFYLTQSELPSICKDHHLTRFYLFSEPSALTFREGVCLVPKVAVQPALQT